MVKGCLRLHVRFRQARVGVDGGTLCCDMMIPGVAAKCTPGACVAAGNADSYTER